MPEVLDFVNGRSVRRGTDSSADLQPSIPEQEAKPRPKAKPKPKPKGGESLLPSWLTGPVKGLQNDLTYEFKQLRKNPIGSGLRLLDNVVGRGPTAGPMGFAGSQALTGVAGSADNIQRMGYSAFQRMTGAKKADPSRGAVGQFIDRQADTTYRLLGQVPPSEQTRQQRDVDMFRRSVATNAMLGAVPGMGPLRVVGATTKLGKAVKGGLAFGANEAASQFLDDNTGGGFSDFVNMALPKDKQIPGGLGSKAGQLDMIDSAFATFGGNVAGGLAVGATVGFLSKALPATARWLRGSRLKAEEVDARGRLATGGVLEDNGDGAYRPGPAVATAAPQKPATFAEADAAMRQKVGEAPAADPAAGNGSIRVDEIEKVFQGMGSAITGNLRKGLWEGYSTGKGTFREDPTVLNARAVEAQLKRPMTEEEFLDVVNGAYENGADAQAWADSANRVFSGQKADPAAELDQVNQQLAQIDQNVADTVEPFGKAQPAALPDEFDPDFDPWGMDPELPEATDVLKTLDQLDPAVIRQMDEAEGSITEMVQQAQQAQQGFQLNPNLRLDRVAAPTDRVSRLYLEGAGEAEGWDQVIEALNPTDLRSLAHPSNSPELAARIESLTGKEWDEFTAGDIRVGMRALSKEGRTVLAERLTGKEFMATEEIAVDPERFQFKQGTDGQGQQTGASLSEEEFWNPRAEDVIEVWDDPADGKTYVVNGHNRLALAKRLGIPSLPVRRIAATKPSSARAFGAIANISQGQGNAFDAAKFIRESGITTPEQLKQAGMTGERSWARDGLALSKLPDDLYRAAVDGDISLRKSVIIGESGLPEPGMRALAAEVRRNPNVPDWELKEIGAMTRSTPAMQSRQGTLEGIGFEVDEGARQKVRLVRLVEEILRKDAKVFGGVAKAAGQLEGKAANTIDRTGSKAVAEEANTGLAAFSRMKYQSGEVSDRLNRAAQQIADGEQPGAVARQVADEMPAILQREMDAAMGRPQAAEVPEVDPDQVDLFAPAEEAPAAPPAMTAAELEAAKMRVVGRALKDGEARPNTTPVPELSEAPRVDPSEALADIQARGGIEADSPAMRALEDELRLVEEQALQDAAARQDALDAMKDSYGYDDLGFEEKKALGMTEGWWDPEVDSRGKGRNFHGAADKISLEEGGEFGGDGMNIYGNGFYTTDDIKTAAAYRKKNRRSADPGAAPTIYEASERAPVKFFDLEKDDSPAVNALLNERIAGGRYGADLIEQAVDDASSGTLGEIMDEMRAWSRSLEIPAYEVQGLFDEIIDALKTEGYGGFTHTGGAKAGGGKRLHKVSIYWDPADAIGLKEIQMGKAPEPDVMPTTVMGEQPSRTPVADRFGKLIDQMVDSDRRMFQTVGEMMDDIKGLADELDPQAAAKAPKGRGKAKPKAVAPVRPEPLRLTQAADQPDFALPEGTTIGTPRYGRFTAAFDSDLDRAAYALSAAKAPKDAANIRQAVEAAGLNPEAVAAHGAKVKAALKELAKSKDKGELRVPRQPWDAGEMASVRQGAGAVPTGVSSPKEIRVMERMAEALIRKVAGKDVVIRYREAYPMSVIKPEWGGDGIRKAPELGSYNVYDDAITINGTGQGSIDAIIETSYHEAFHRVQFTALSEGQRRALDSAIARLKVDLGSRIGGISYIESQAVAFQRYARAKATGSDPIAALVGAERLQTGKTPSRLEKAALAVISAFDKIADFAERVVNGFRGNGFTSVQDIFEKARSGALSKGQAEAFLDDDNWMDMMMKWSDFDSMHRGIKKQASAIDTQIAEIQQRAAREGC